MNKVVIVDAKRTSIGSFLGSLSSFTAPQLGKIVIENLLQSNNLDPEIIDEVILGNVLSAGIGQAPARQAALYAGLPNKVECLTINKMCGSGLKALMLAQQSIALGDADIIIAGGIESMSNAPYIIPKARNGYRMGHGAILDSMINDGLWDIYNNIHMGNCAESCAREYQFKREELDAFAVESYNRTLNAQQKGIFKDEIVPIEIIFKKDRIVVDSDEEPGKVKFDKIPLLKPAFEKDGVITAANASKINDGASAILIMSEKTAKRLNLVPMAEIVSQASFAKAPVDFATAPIDAIAKVINKSGIKLNQIELFEINEAFAVVTLAAQKKLNLDPEKVNVNGGAIALGHPIGASGARILTTLVHEMRRRNAVYGLATLCIGGGEASAVIIKNYN